jgi:hypothetical protein
MIKLNRVYRHFKGGYYLVKDIGYDCEDGNEWVIYQSLSDDKIWIRKLSSFMEEVEEGRDDNPTNQKYRFEYIELNKEEKQC